ncbi:MAG: hypothetical protein PHR77_07480, partial [Kiritimatiellae bacterium]|nr:hypothetical protein [Kiritimatiellia bacterium]
DGGILPTPFPATQVVTEEGKPLASYVLWQNRGYGTGVIFEDPTVGSNVYVYVTAADALKLWNPQTGLRPSMFLCAEAGTESLAAASNLGKLGVTGPNMYFQKYGTSTTPFGMREGDPQGRQSPICYYLLAYIITTDPGRTLIAVTTKNGQCQVRIDGSLINPQRISSKSGGLGQWIDLSKGLHKVDVVSSVGLKGTGEAKEQWSVWWLGWRTPHTTPEQLGGVRPKDLASPGTPMWESHVLLPEEIVRTGSCKIREISSKDGGPVAVVQMEATENFWFGDEPPIITYDLSAVTAGNPEKTQYTWKFGDAAKITEPKISWFFRGGNQNVTLTAVAGGKQSSCTVPFYAFSGTRSSMDSAFTKENFRKACYFTMKAYPAEVDPTALWSKTMFNFFYDSQEFGKGSELLDEILTKRWNFFVKKIPIEKQVMLEDIFFNWIAQNDADKAIRWLKTQETASPSADRRNSLKIMQAEVLMYQKGNFKEARKILEPITKGTDDSAAVANIRLGDIAFLERNMNDANNYWGLVQGTVRMTKGDIKGEGTEIKWDDGSGGKKKRGAPVDNSQAFTSAAIKNEKVDAWKKTAVVDTSKALAVQTLVTQGFLMEAFQEMRRWERTMPMSKISSDYIIQEANFYLAIGNTKRARKMLEAYCENVDVAGYVAAATETILNCMLKDKEPDKVLKQFCDDTRKRFQFHPLADRMNELMRVISTDGIKRDATSDKL